MPNLWRLSSLSWAFIAAFSAVAQAGELETSASRKYALPELVTLALERTELLDSQEARAEEQRLAARQARALPGPSVQLSGGRKRTDADSGPRYAASIEQPLPLLGKRGLRGNILDLESEAWQVRRAASKLEVTLSVVESTFEYALNRRRAAFTQARQKRFDLMQEFLAGRPFPSPQKKAESRIVHNRLRSLAAETIQSQAAFKSSLEKLRVYAPLDAGALPDVEIPWLSGGKSLESGEWTARTLANNFDLRAQEIAVQAASVERKLASREGLPEPSLIASYEQARAGETERNFGLGLGLALPSWNRNRSGVRSAAQRRLAEERLLAFQKQRLAADVSRVLVEYEAARQVALQYPETRLAELEEQLREADEGFRKGQLDLLTFLELDGSASETFSRALEAQLGLVSKAAELWLMSGEQDVLAQVGALR